MEIFTHPRSFIGAKEEQRKVFTKSQGKNLSKLTKAFTRIWSKGKFWWGGVRDWDIGVPNNLKRNSRKFSKCIVTKLLRSILQESNRRGYWKGLRNGHINLQRGWRGRISKLWGRLSPLKDKIKVSMSVGDSNRQHHQADQDKLRKFRIWPTNYSYHTRERPGWSGC